jgi:hypothetical protein
MERRAAVTPVTIERRTEPDRRAADRRAFERRGREERRVSGPYRSVG